MELVRERQNTQVVNAELEAQQHNAQISERYRMLQSAEADQFASETMASAPVYAAPVSETPVMEQTPAVTDYVREGVSASVFTSEKFDRMQGFGVENAYAAPAIEQAPIMEMATEAVEHYALTPLAKIVMAVFTVIVVAMIALIGVNSSILNKKQIKLKNLEQKRDQLVERHDEIQSRIEIAQSEESILAWAESQGMVQVGN